jgi:hypothetical protein
MIGAGIAAFQRRNILLPGAEMKNYWFSAREIRELCLRRCDTIFYTLVLIVAVARAIVDVQNGEFSKQLYSSLIDVVSYRELIRLFLWVQENPRYAIASLYGAVIASAIPVMFSHPGAFVYECTVYLILRFAAGLVFGLDEKQVFKLYVDVLFDYYNRTKPPRRRDGKRRKTLLEMLAPEGVFAPSGA